ncbi:MAG: MBL fold metallo-hydrolase [Candidatus Omnitrophica bacterium]|nr:MBL fold metallo-hydrolase [Candidatus Omnitrophota bacterium]MBI2495130.1 MBL fold metallo-hydrolase [Candidatus Omnitrophota bacterium]MBI3020596.1 MBL fold metallo-hydrolase [Candidatus Omnitrophota bacterium]MBI3083017.1 MBL fold metallo-hydrolase [Candidatus Omnitrophota bacterium]
MRVVVLGAGTAIPARGHSPAGLYVQAGGEHLLFDAGPGTAQRVHQAGVSLWQIDRIFLTHAHVDHCLDLVTILFALRIPQPVRKKPLAIYGPRGLTRLYRQLNAAFHRWLEPRTYRLTLNELGETTRRFHGYTITTRWMRHSTPALGYRLEVSSKRLAYSGDTDVCDNIVAIGRDADLLILECSHPDERKVAGHLTPTECGRIAAAAHCRHLALTHFYPVFQGYDIRARVRRSFHGRLTLAKDFTTLRV